MGRLFSSFGIHIFLFLFLRRVSTNMEILFPSFHIEYSLSYHICLLFLNLPYLLTCPTMYFFWGQKKYSVWGSYGTLHDSMMPCFYNTRTSGGEIKWNNGNGAFLWQPKMKKLNRIYLENHELGIHVHMWEESLQ